MGTEVAQTPEEGGVAHEGHLHHLGQPAPQLARRLRPQEAGVDEHRAGGLEAAEVVLPPAEVDPALEADARVDLRQQGRRHAHVGQASAHEAGRHGDDVAAHPAADRDEHVTTTELGLLRGGADGEDRLDGLGALAEPRADHDVHGARQRREVAPQGGPVQAVDLGVDHHQAPATGDRIGQGPVGRVEHPTGQEDLVRTVGGAVEPVHRTPLAVTANASRRCRRRGGLRRLRRSGSSGVRPREAPRNRPASSRASPAEPVAGGGAESPHPRDVSDRPGDVTLARGGGLEHPHHAIAQGRHVWATSRADVSTPDPTLTRDAVSRRPASATSARAASRTSTKSRVAPRDPTRTGAGARPLGRRSGGWPAAPAGAAPRARDPAG